MAHLTPAPATPSQQLTVIRYCTERLAKAAAINPAVLGPAVEEDIREAYLLLIGAAEYVEEQGESAAARLSLVAGQ